ncbi:hypothetical protein ElyMa_005145200 [Elysia marginata]|uniref:Uncharacterized protein n=1 Tax=Elysia marginata TaxID=1093978 RepID=A0AAV4JSM9_9GAST|nr:hypothetical protein ElyMa_005145200 [Elysia marginata]
MNDPFEATTRDSDVFKSEAGESTKPLDVLVTAPSMDLDVDSGGSWGATASPGSDKTDGEKATKTRIGSDISDKVDSRTSSTSEMDMDFSILELPTTAHLNFDMSNHKRTLSKKGSFSLRKKPTRAAIHTSKLATSEDSIFVDSTEPRPPKIPVADNEEESQEQTAKKREAEMTREESPPRPAAKKVAGGMKIPGLLEGLMGSKRFNRNENKQTPSTSSADKTSSTTSSASSFSSKATSEAAASSVSKPSASVPMPAPRPKPAALPRVLPTLPSRPLRSVNTSNAKTSEENTSSSSSILSKKLALKSSETAENIGPSNLSPMVKKDMESTSSPLSSGKDTKTPVSYSPVKDTKANPSLTPSRVLPSIGGADSKKPSPSLGNEKPEVRKKPPTVMKKPALRSRPERSAVTEEKSEVKDAELQSVFNKRLGESKLSENSLCPDKLALSESKQSAQKDNFDDKETSVEGKSNTKASDEKNLEETFEIVDKSDSKDEKKTDLSESKTTVSTSVISPLEEIQENKVSLKDGSSELSKENVVSSSNKSVSSSAKETPKGPTQSSPFSSTTPPQFMPKPNISKPKPDTPTKPTSMTPVARKSSVSSVKPPSSSDKTSSSSKPSSSPAGNMGRRDSITGSAYNPMGFRSALGSSDSGSESRSRGSSVSSEKKSRGDSVSSTGSDMTKKISDLNSGRGLTKVSSDSPADDKVEVIMRKKPEKLETKPSWLTEANKNSLNRAKRPEVPSDKTKEAADEANKIIKDQGSLRKVSSTMSSTKNETSSEDNKSSSPWGVRLRKVDSSRPKSVVEPTNNENSSPGVNWRQQMSQKRQSYVPPKELEKPKQQDSTPEWAKASTLRRQRLLDAGVINSDAK